MRWLFHVLRAEDLSWGQDGRYAPRSFAEEGFIHASYKGVVAESAKLYFPEGARLVVLVIDPRRLDVPVEVVETPRGPMPHIRGSIPSDAIRVLPLDAVADHADAVRGAKIGLVAFSGMTLLDLVGPLDALSRIASMGFDETTVCEVFALAWDEDGRVWSACGLDVRAARLRPPLDEFDLLVVPGGPGARRLEDDPDVAEYLSDYPENRLVASVCTGALLLGAAGRLGGRRATTHASAMADLARLGATPVAERVVDEGQLVTAAGVTAGIELGLHLVERLMGAEVRARIAAQMEAR
jgi:putative intracellular protease/amidase/uncharacterized protein (DUF952 family)